MVDEESCARNVYSTDAVVVYLLRVGDEGPRIHEAADLQPGFFEADHCARSACVVWFCAVGDLCNGFQSFAVST